MNKVYIFKVFFLISCFFIYSKGSREISCFVNPGLNATTTNDVVNTNVIYIKSEGQNDIIHFVWSSYKFPSVIVARTTTNTTLSINATKVISFEKDAITFKNGQPLESIGITFSKFWEAQYNNDSSPLEDALSVEDLDMESFFWIDVNNTLKCSKSFASVNMKGRNNDSTTFSKDGMLEIQFSVSSDQELSDQFPRLVFTGNSTLLKFSLVNLYSNHSCTRYGFGLSLFSPILNECENDWDTVVANSINDEVSPGVFSDVELLAQCSNKTQLKSAFLSWRPVAYTGVKPIVANSSDVVMSNLASIPNVEVLSIAELYFHNKSNMTSFNVTFGTLGDGCYVSTEYTSWSLMAGTGTKLEVPLSTVVIILASVGIGLLILFLLSGSIFVVYKRCKDKDDDLLLN